MNASTPTPATHQPRPAAKHTPGPWIADIEEYPYRREIFITTENYDPDADEGERICRVFDDTNIGIANARLIAASPELLRELKKCVAAIQKWGKAHPESGGWTGLIHGGLAAIAQAEGRANA